MERAAQSKLQATRSIAKHSRQFPAYSALCQPKPLHQKPLTYIQASPEARALLAGLLWALPTGYHRIAYTLYQPYLGRCGNVLRAVLLPLSPAGVALALPVRRSWHGGGCPSLLCLSRCCSRSPRRRVRLSCCSPVRCCCPGGVAVPGVGCCCSRHWYRTKGTKNAHPLKKNFQKKTVPGLLRGRLGVGQLLRRLSRNRICSARSSGVHACHI